MKVKNLIIVGVCIMWLYSCKKEESKETPQQKQIIRGNLSAIIEKDSNSNITFARASAQFLDSKFSHITFEPESITINGALLDLGESCGCGWRYKYWYSSLPFNCLENVVWNNTSSEAVPAFTYTATHPIPFIDTSYISVDSISLTNGLTISHPKIIASEIRYDIYNRVDGYLTEFTTNVVNENSSGTTFTSAQLLQGSFKSGMIPELVLTVTTKETYSPKANLVLDFSTQCIIKKHIIIK